MTALYEIETSEGDDGAMRPVEQLWAPGEGAVENGFIAHRGLHVTGLDDPTDDHLYPIAFLVLGHQKWADIIEAAAAHMARVHGWRNLHLYPDDDPAVLIPRIPRAVRTHGVFLRHPAPGPRLWVRVGRHLAHGLGAGHRTRCRPNHRDAAPRRAGDCRRHPQP
ncbi:MULTISPECIES: hypothetical protein [Streptomyces]|uniref:hypothetical protein n=1 Tax=Streptomyces TaxID=1883 RepID=UPI00345BF9A4